MARVKGPLMSMEARGNVTGGRMQFRTTPTGTHVYQPMEPTAQNQSPPTPAQERQRLRFKAACNAWTALSQSEKEDYKTQAVTLGISGYSFFIREYLYLASFP